MRRLCKQSAYTLIEILLATLLIASMAAVLFSAFATARTWMSRAVNSPAVNLARERLEELGMEVRHDTWNTGLLNPTAVWINEGSVTIEGVTYAVDRRVSPMGVSGFRRVDARVRW